MLELAFDEDGKERVVALRDGILTLGSGPACDVVLRERGIGDRHAKVVTGNGESRLTSFPNDAATVVNGVVARVALLRHGDRIRLGDLELHVRRALDDSVDIRADEPPVPRDTVVRRMEDVERLLEKTRSDGPGVAVAEMARVNRMLRCLTDLSRALITADPDDLPRRVMDAIFAHTSAERGFVMLRDDRGDLRPHVVRHRDPSDGERITVSRTIAERVITERVAILSRDAQKDARFVGGKSVQEFQIRSMMCAPLLKGDDVIGIVHVDSPSHVGSFDEGDLELLSALSSYAAAAIAQTRLAARARDERAARQRLERYFSPAVATRILSEGDKVAEEMEATILFADVVGFSRLAERMPPARVADLLNEYLARLADMIHEHDGTVDKFIGDCIMAVFGAPYPQDDHARLGIAVALEMRRLVTRLNESRGIHPIELRIGINTGRVVTGPIGSATRRELTVVGDAVNIAARIASTVARAGSIVIGERTFALADGALVVDLGEVALRGREEKVRVYEVQGLRPSPFG